MNSLKNSSIKISATTVACWPDGQEEIINATEIRSKFNGAYSTNNSTICFVADGEVFVTPYTRDAMNTIERAGLIKKYFYVPFSNGDYPKHERAKWFRLRHLAAESYHRDYEDDSAAWCDEHGIGSLNEETMSRCFRMPSEGVPVKHPHYEDTYYPACNEGCVDTYRLGRYCFNNGRVVFVYRDGHTYVAKGRKIIDELLDAGYKESKMFVPFSNGEQITDRYYATKWEEIPKK